MLADHFCFHVNPQKSNVYYNICIIKYIHTHKHTDVNQKHGSLNIKLEWNAPPGKQERSTILSLRGPYANVPYA